MSEYVKNSDLFINLVTGEYPFTLYKIKKNNTHIFFGPKVLYGLLYALGYALVNPTDKPDTDVAIEGKPYEIDGQYYQSWTGRDFTPEEARIALIDKKSEIKNKIVSHYEHMREDGYIDEDTGISLSLTESGIGMLLNRNALIQLGYNGDFVIKSKLGTVHSLSKDQMSSLIKNCLLYLKKLDELLILLHEEIEQMTEIKQIPSYTDIVNRFEEISNN